MHFSGPDPNPELEIEMGIKIQQEIKWIQISLNLWLLALDMYWRCLDSHITGIYVAWGKSIGLGWLCFGNSLETLVLSDTHHEKTDFKVPSFFWYDTDF